MWPIHVSVGVMARGQRGHGMWPLFGLGVMNIEYYTEPQWSTFQGSPTNIPWLGYLPHINQ